MGCLGDIVFTVSDQTVRTLNNWKWSGSARYAVHQRHRGRPLTEFTGLDPDKITFDMKLMAELGVNPLEEVKRIWKYERSGTAIPLTIGRHAYGYYRWNIVSHEMTTEYTDTEGNLMGVSVSVTLQEYLKS